jgi:four helix bundle protein
MRGGSVSSVGRFEELIAWQKARELVRMVYAATSEGALRRDVRLSGQIQGAAVSVMSNIAEGFEREGHAEFAQFLRIAKASCAEVRSLLYVALDADLLARSQFDHLMSCSEEVSRIVAGLRASVIRRHLGGPPNAPRP